MKMFPLRSSRKVNLDHFYLRRAQCLHGSSRVSRDVFNIFYIFYRNHAEELPPAEQDSGSVGHAKKQKNNKNNQRIT